MDYSVIGQDTIDMADYMEFPSEYFKKSCDLFMEWRSI
jgi:hypothetical protein